MKTKKRVLSLFLSGIMTLSLLPSAAFSVEAAETQEQPAVVVDDEQASSANDGVSVTADTGEDAPPQAGDTTEIAIDWSRTKESKWNKDGLGGLYVGEKSDYEHVVKANDSDGVSRAQSATFTWNWNTISKKLANTSSSMTVWDYGTKNQYTNSNPTDDPSLGILPSEDYSDAATWNNRDTDGTFDTGSANSYTVRKISGTFTWPEGYDLSDNIELISVDDNEYQKIYDTVAADSDLTAAFGGKRVLAINDDVYAFLYKDGDTLTNNNYLSYMAFWTGTAGKGVWSHKNSDFWTNNWGSTWTLKTPATYQDVSALQAFQGVAPNLDRTAPSSTRPDALADMQYLYQSDGWYAFMDGNSLSTVLNNHYKNTNLAGQKFHIDFYCFDTDKVGGMDQLKLQMTKAQTDEVNVEVRYWMDGVSDTSDNNYLGSTWMTNQKINDKITLPDGTDVNELNYKRAAAITKNNGKEVTTGVQQDAIPYIVKDKDNVINVVYTATGEFEKLLYTYDFGVKNKYADVLNADDQKTYPNVEVQSSKTNYVTYSKKTNTLTYEPQSVLTNERVSLYLSDNDGNNKQIDVIFLPESNVLYEENFLTKDDSTAWTLTGENDTSTVASDNGKRSVSGYTEAYDKTSNDTFSNGSAYMASLMLINDETSVKTATDKTFTFSGTGFDLISECGTNTGMLIVGVKNIQTNEVVKGYIVDTYFSGDNSEDFEPIISGEGILAYQIPVVRAMDLPRGKYEVTVRGYLTESAGAIVNKGSDTIARAKSTRASKKDLAKAILRDAGMEEYSKNVELSYMDDNSVLNGGTGAAASTTKNKNTIARVAAANRNTAVQVYIDGFRVYQPRSDESSYVDNEKNMKYGSVYDYVNASKSDSDAFVEDSVVYVEYNGDVPVEEWITKYKDQGPQNEVYLTAGNYIGFVLDNYTKGQHVMVSAKSIHQGTGASLYAIKNGEEPQEIAGLGKCGTEMYYDVTDCISENDGKYYLILGNGEEDNAGSVLSVSGIKLPKDTTSTSSAETSNAIAKMVSLAYTKDTTFAPKYFKVHAKSKVKAGKRTTIKVTASTTVDHIAIYTNSKCTKPVSSKAKAIQPDNKKAVRKGTARRYTFHTSVKIAKRQKYSYYVVAYDKNGNASDPVKVSITGKR